MPFGIDFNRAGQLQLKSDPDGIEPFVQVCFAA